MKPLILVLVAATGLSAHAQVPGAQMSRVDEVFKAYARTDSPGCAVGAYKDGGILYARAYGMANLDHDVPLAPRSVFHVASVSKQFTAAAILLLAADGKLSLDDPVQKHIPELADFGAPVTIRHLIHHTSGIRDQWTLLGLAGWRYSRDLITDDDVMWLLSRQKELNFPPGERHLYSNSGYTLLAVIVSRVSGRPFREFTTERIFKPLGMTNTFFRDNFNQVVKHQAYGYSPSGGSFRLSVTNFDTAGATSLLTNVEDLAKWNAAFDKPVIGGPMFLGGMLERGVLSDGTRIDYASGVTHGTQGGLPTVSHGGSDAGYRSAFLRFPEQRFGVSVLCNISTANPTALAGRVAAIHLGDVMKADAPAPAPADADVPVSAEELTRLAGMYWSTSAAAARSFEVKDGRLHLVQGSGARPLTSLGNGRFLLPGAQRIYATFEKDRLTAGPEPGRGDVYLRTEPFRPSGQELEAFSGAYRSEELDSVYRLRPEAGVLRLERLKMRSTPLQPLVADTFTSPAGVMRFTRDAAGRVDGFRLEAGRVRGLLFRKEITLAPQQARQAQPQQRPPAAAPQPAPLSPPTRADFLRGEYGPHRANNDLLFYHLDVRVDPGKKYISGRNRIRFRMLADGSRIQLDLYPHFTIEKILLGETALTYERDLNAVFVNFPKPLEKGREYTIDFHYSGTPVETGRFGGFTFGKDPEGNPWIVTANEGPGAMVWWPNKDQWRDEPLSMDISVAIPNGLTNVSNGRLLGQTDLGDGYTRWDYRVHYPINSYNVSLNIAKYAHFGERMGDLTLDYYVLPANLEKAKRQFAQAKPMIQAFEKIFGEYPFTKDGYKLIEVPYSGMEHQSAVTYGNRFANGYLERDWTGVGVSLKFDFIIIHESGHEWFGNAVSAADVSDMWIHEGFTTYLENLYVEQLFGYDDALKYVNGYKSKVRNREPIITQRGTHRAPSQDMYFKGALFLNTLRNIVNDDAKWWKLMRDLFQHFKYRNILTEELVDFVNVQLERDLTPIFNQYLRRAALPVLELAFNDEEGTLAYRWKADERAFAMPVRIGKPDAWQIITPTTAWQLMKAPMPAAALEVATDLYYIDVVKQAAPAGERAPAPQTPPSIEQTSQGERPSAELVASFDGLGVGFSGPHGVSTGRNPSDNSLAVGPNHVFQIVNSRMAIFDKTGKVLYGAVPTNTIFKGFGGTCEARNNGDAVVRYDQLAGRWLVVMPIFRRAPTRPDQPPVWTARPAAWTSPPGVAGQPGAAARLFVPPPAPPAPATPPAQPGARGGQPAPRPPQEQGPYSMCYAISTSPDPLGTYHRYEFLRSLFPDYPRPAVWPDGYYVPTSTGDEVIQKHACVVEREKMLRGEPAREQCVIIDGVNFLNNADLHGKALPPAGAPNIMMASGGTQLKKDFGDDGIYAWSFSVDWGNPARTKVSGPVKIPVAPYHYLCDGQLTSCVPQPGTDRRLDAQGDKIMSQLVYRNVAGRESIVAVHSVDTAAGGGGVRWYEFGIDAARAVTLRQQGTYAPGGFYRWMASPAIDKAGNIGIGYSFGGTPHFAGQRFAARLAGDPPGRLTLGESVLVEGEAAQTNTLRWEDYTQTAIDPVDDCTIWYVGDYYKKDATNYSTRIGAFRLPGCR